MCKDSAYFLMQTDCPIEDYWNDASAVIDAGRDVDKEMPTLMEMHLAHLVAELVMEIGNLKGFSVPEDFVS